MMKKASGIVEVALIMCLVTVVSLAVLKIYNNQKLQLVKMSTVTVRK